MNIRDKVLIIVIIALVPSLYMNWKMYPYAKVTYKQEMLSELLAERMEQKKEALAFADPNGGAITAGPVTLTLDDLCNTKTGHAVCQGMASK
jgi:hypothetical protein